jgi:hypothetical protein
MRLVIEDGIPENAEGSGAQEELRRIFERCLHLQQQKAFGYGEAWREQGYMGNVGRVLSKASRLRNLLWRDDQRIDALEGVAETLLDLINLVAFAHINWTQRNKWGR